MSALEKKFRAMEEAFAKETENYLESHKKLDEFRGVELNDEKLVVQVNQILMDIQDTYSRMYPVINFIMQNYQKAAKYHAGHNKFIDDIKAGGAKPDYEVQ